MADIICVECEAEPAAITIRGEEDATEICLCDPCLRAIFERVMADISPGCIVVD